MIRSVYEENKKHLHPRGEMYGGDQFLGICDIAFAVLEI
jgi:hypothetical protein